MTEHVSAPEASGQLVRWAIAGLAGIWIAVLVISIGAPDLVSGSQQEHLPLALFTTWIWGLVGTIGYLWGMAKLRGATASGRPAIALTVATLVVWAIAAAVSVAMPPWVTGSDPTSLPLWALAAPLGAALVTVLAAVVAGLFGPARSAAPSA
jgi:hypothetical protein